MRAIGGVLAIALATACVGCSVTVSPLDTGESRGQGSTITVGSQGSAENEILAQLYGQVLENANYVVEYDRSIGSRADYLKYLAAGTIDLVPDYAGTLLHAVNPKALATSITDISSAMPGVLEPLGLIALEPSSAENADALAVTPEFAAANAVASIGDLAPFGSAVTIGAAVGFDDSWTHALGTVYGVSDFAFRAVDETNRAETTKTLLDNIVQVLHVPTTSPIIATNNLVVLQDPANLFLDENVVPVIDVDLYSDEIAALLNGVSAVLTTQDLAKLNALYFSDDRPTAAQIATDWLTEKRLLN